MVSNARILRCGEQAFSVEIANEIDEIVNRRVIALAKDLKADPPDGLVELVPSYRSLLVCFDPGRINRKAMEQALRDRLDRVHTPEESTGALWHIPAVYGGEAGLDLDDLAREKGLSPREFIKLWVDCRRPCTPRACLSRDQTSPKGRSASAAGRETSIPWLVPRAGGSSPGPR